MPIWFVVYVQKIYGAGYVYYQVLKSVPATIDDIERLFQQEVHPLQYNAASMGDHINYWVIYREPENPFQLQARIAELEEENRDLSEQLDNEYLTRPRGTTETTAYTTGR